MPIRRFRRYLLDRLVLRPSQHPIDASGQRRITFPTRFGATDGFEQHVGLPDAPRNLIVVKFPGTSGRAERSSAFPFPLMQGMTGKVITWNPPGYGGSEGKASLDVIANAASEMLSHVIANELGDEEKGSEAPNGSESRGVSANGTSLWLCGNSLGCNTALHLASDPRTAGHVSGLILRNPPPLIPLVKHIASGYPMGRWIHPVADSLIPQMNALHTAPRAMAPAVFLQSELDSLVPPDFQRTIIDAYGGAKRIVPLEGLDHDGIATEEHEDEIEASLKWLWQQSATLVTS